jgi:hypothetical protein
MKTNITSNWRPLLRALCTLLIGIAALWSIPGTARAQLYVGLRFAEFAGGVGEYDATTGEAINANLIRGLNGSASGLALRGNILFVAVVNSSGGFVGKYDATTGAAISPSFITGLDSPRGLAVQGNILFVANFTTIERVGKYDAKTGEAINANFITGLRANAEGLALQGNTLFVASDSGSKAPVIVGKYNAITGDAINANFITPPVPPIFGGLALLGDRVFVGSIVGSEVSEYDAITGEVINANFITGLVFPQAPQALAVKSAN